MCEQGGEQRCKQRAPLVPQRIKAAPLQSRVRQYQQPTAAPNPIVQAHELRRSKSPRLSKQEQLPVAWFPCRQVIDEVNVVTLGKACESRVRRGILGKISFNTALTPLQRQCCHEG